MSLRIAVLLTNDDTSAFASHFPNDGQKVVQLLQPLRPDWSFEVVPVKDGVLPASPKAFDGYVITGSPASVNDDNLPWIGQLLDFIRAVHTARQPLIGLCFGHQAVARALGGQVEFRVVFPDGQMPIHFSKSSNLKFRSDESRSYHAKVKPARLARA